MLLTKRLVQKGLLVESDLERVREAQAAAPSKPVHEILIEKGFAKEEVVLAALAEELGMDLVDLSKKTVEPEVLQALPLKLVHRHTLMPLARDNGTLIVATGDPFDVYALDELQTVTGLHVIPVLASPREIARLIKTHFGVGGETVSSLMQERANDGVELLEELETDDSELAKMAQEASVVRLVNEILVEAANERASDIHIEHEEKALRIRYRIDGILQTQNLPPEINRFQAAIVSRLKIMAHLNIAEKRLPQDGRIKMRVQNREIDVRVSIIPMIHGEETADSAIQASLTGHMVFSTLHTNDAPSAFTRLIDMGVEPFLVSSTVEGVMAQRLVRTICKECKISYQPEHSEVPRDFPGFDPGKPDVPTLWKGAGCRACRQTGYRGRAGIFELMVTGEEIRELVTQRVNAGVIRKHALAAGMLTLRQDGWRKVLSGMTTIEEVARATAGDLVM